jgi:hypothetical protein
MTTTGLSVVTALRGRESSAALLVPLPRVLLIDRAVESATAATVVPCRQPVVISRHPLPGGMRALGGALCALSRAS